MKKITLTLGLFLMMNNFYAQKGLEKIIVEKYYVSDEKDSINASNQGAVAPLRIGSVTYRVYADLAPGYKFIQMYGDQNHDFIVNTSTNFYNDPNYGGVTPEGMSVANAKKNTALIDSWFSVGAAASGQIGVPKTQDTDGSVGNNSSVLANNPGGEFGAPITGALGKDGMMTGTPISPNKLGFTNELDIFDQTEGNSFKTNGGTIAALGGAKGINDSNVVLLGQFTTNGIFSFELNLQLGTPTVGGSEIYVAKNAKDSEILFPELIFTSKVDEDTTTNTASLNALSTKSPIVTLTPNPTLGKFNLKIDNASSFKNNSFLIQDITGVVVENQEIGLVNQNYTKSIDLTHFPAGVYFVKVTLDNQTTTHKVVKN
jgi:hypothetical protein